jgi:UDP-4-amino-4,6-dideoxy-N-acetyl-beta-L-altrosamine transaminase
MIPYGRQHIDELDIQAVLDVLRSDWLTQGPAIPRFEESVARYCGVEHAVAVSNATAALHISCLALGLGPGDRLWTSPNTFVASANCALYCGASVDFVDIDPRTYNISVAALATRLEEARRTGKLPKVLVAVHFAGQSCQMREIRELGERYGFRIIEDASHAIGGRYLSKPVGSCEFSDIAVFSFHPVKVITTGEGGMALTRSPHLANRLRLLRTHGITRDVAQMSGESHGDWYYEQVELGFNYRMTDIQAALGTSQMQRLDEFVTRRHAIAARYDDELKPLGVTLPWQHPDTYSALHLYPIRFSGQQGRRKALFGALRAAGVGVNVHYIPVHIQPYYRELGFRKGDFSEAERYYDEAVSLPMFPKLTDDQQSHVIRAVADCLR